MMGHSIKYQILQLHFLIYLYWLTWATWLVWRLIGNPVIHPSVPGVEIEFLVVQPGTVGETHFQCGDSNNPVWRRTEHADHRDQVMSDCCKK